MGHCFAEQYLSGLLLPAPNSHMAARVYICKPWEKKRHCGKVLRYTLKKQQRLPHLHSKLRRYYIRLRYLL